MGLLLILFLSRKGHSFDQSSGIFDARNNEQELKGDPSHNCFCVPWLEHPNCIGWPTSHPSLVCSLQLWRNPDRNRSKGEICLVEEESYALYSYCGTVNSSCVGQSALLNGAAGDQVLLIVKEVYEGDCPMEIYGSRIEGLCEEETAVLNEVSVGRTERNLLRPTPIQTSQPDLPDVPDSRSESGMDSEILYPLCQSPEVGLGRSDWRTSLLHFTWTTSWILLGTTEII
jgi:hypothetical protein